MSLTSGDQIAAAGVQPVIGAFVQDILRPEGATNFVGCNPLTGYDTNSMGIAINTTCNTSFGTTAAAKPATYASVSVILIPTDRVNLAAGVATKDNVSGTHNVLANVPANGFFWAVLR